MSEHHEGSIVTFCNPLLDINASVDNSFLEKYGLEADNAILADERHERLFEEIESNFSVTYMAGGAGQNSARVAQWLLPAHSVVFVGAVGKDDHASKLREVVRSDGLQVEYLETPEDPTGTCAVLLTSNGRHRSLIARLGAARSYRLEHLLEERLQAHLASAKIIYFTGFFLPVSPETIKHLAQISQQHQKTLVMNLSAPFLSELCKEQMLKTLPFVDILVGNRLEVIAFAKANGFEQTDDTKQIIKNIAKLWNTKTIIITDGKFPTILHHQGNLEEFPVEPILESQIKDTNGAGDAFVGGFLSQLVQGKPLAECIVEGHRIAGLIIRNIGVDRCSLDSLT